MRARTRGTLVGLARAFDGWLHLNGAGDSLQRDGGSLRLREKTGILPGGSYVYDDHALELRHGRISDSYTHDLATQVDVIGHELGHAATWRSSLLFSLSEAVADVLALSFARASGRAATDDWTIDAGGKKPVRDLRRLRFASLGAALRHIDGHVTDTPWFPVHALGDPVRAIVVGLHAQLGFVAADRIVRQALLRELPATTRDRWNEDEMTRRGMRRQRHHELYVEQFRAITDALIAASSAIAGPDSTTTSVVRRTIEAVGGVAPASD